MPATTVREQILAYLAVLLTNAAGFTFYRSREAPVTRAEGIVGILEPEEEEPEYVASRLIRRRLLVRIRLIVRASANEPVADSVADPAVLAIYNALMADQTLGGLCALIVDEATAWSFEVADRTALEVGMRFRITYATQINNLAQPA